MKRIAGLIYKETSVALCVFLESVIKESVTYTEHVGRKQVPASDVDGVRVPTEATRLYAIWLGKSMSKVCLMLTVYIECPWKRP